MIEELLSSALLSHDMLMIVAFVWHGSSPVQVSPVGRLSRAWFIFSGLYQLAMSC